MEAFLVVRVDVELARRLRGPGRVGEAECAVAGGVQDGPVGQHGEGHGLAQFGRAQGQLDLLVVGCGDVGRDAWGAGIGIGGRGGDGGDGQGGGQQCGERGDVSGPPRGCG
ncbi:hypothetical protein Smic_22060 [Streptomyces microflavus]|uniref:Uncharacterized protein n=1 Tax=Streptomyces microflavus TaxID=1919 RepID=A0A7J0CMC1_STRMI|nr:hypothetical protein Smic_22060 [Streptomyces microflavus]